MKEEVKLIQLGILEHPISLMSEISVLYMNDNGSSLMVPDVSNKNRYLPPVALDVLEKTFEGLNRTRHPHVV